MQASRLYRITAVLLLLFAAGHFFGFRQIDPAWGIGPLIDSMQSTHFKADGFDRSYWDFYLAGGFSVGVLFLFAATLAWQLGGLPAGSLVQMRGVTWAFAGCFATITILSFRYLFIIPIAFSSVITLCLVAAAWRGGQRVMIPADGKGATG